MCLSCHCVSWISDTIQSVMQQDLNAPQLTLLDKAAKAPESVTASWTEENSFCSRSHCDPPVFFFLFGYTVIRLEVEKEERLVFIWPQLLSFCSTAALLNTPCKEERQEEPENCVEASSR